MILITSKKNRLDYDESIMKTHLAPLAFFALLLTPGATRAQNETPLMRFLALCETAELQLLTHVSASITLTEAEKLIASLPASQQPASRRELAAYLGKAGNFAAAEQQLAFLPRPAGRNQALCTLIAFTTAAGDFSRTERLLTQITDPECAVAARTDYTLAMLRSASVFTKNLLFIGR